MTRMQKTLPKVLKHARIASAGTVLTTVANA